MSRWTLQSVLPRLWIGLFLLSCLPGCVGQVVKRSELPQDAIAVLYWDSEEGRRRLEMIGEEVDSTTPSVLREGVAELGRANKLFSEDSQMAVDARYPGRLMLLDPRTLDLTRVEQSPPGSIPLAWSADHRYLLFMTDRLSGRHQVYRLDIETGEVRTAVGSGKRHVAGAFDAAGNIALARIEHVGGGQLRPSIVVSRGGRRPVTVVEETAVRHLGFAPDGSYIVYTPRSYALDQKADRGRPSMMVQEISWDAEPKKGSKEAKERKGPRELALGTHPVVTRDGEWIVYSAPVGRGKEQSARVRRVRVDGTGRTNIGRSVRREDSPAVSPDGRFVVYVSRHNGLDRLFVKRFEGEGDRLLFDDGVVAYPVW